MALTEHSALAKDLRNSRQSDVMQHRHYALIASIIAAYPADKRLELAKHFADGLAGSNRNFDRQRFLRASSVIAL